jgi:ribokinase
VKGLGKGAIVTLGDAVIDVIVESAALPVTDDDVPAAIGLGLGGQAANVAAWCAHLGTPSALIAPVGDDPTGRLIRDALGSRGVEWLGPVAEGRSGVVVSLVLPDGTRTMLSDRGASAHLQAASLRPHWFAGVRWLHVSGYSLFGPAGAGTALAAGRMARAAGASVSVDLSASTLLNDLGAAQVRELIDAIGAEVVFGNELESSVVGSVPAPVLAIKRGAAGCRVVTAEGVKDVPAAPGAVVRDTTGCGDAFAAGWLLGGVDAALDAARQCAAVAGAMPPIR